MAPGNEYKITIHAKHDIISVEVDGQELLSTCDVDHPYLQGSIGLGVLEAVTLPVSIFLFHKSMRNIRFKKGEKNEGSSCD